MNHPPYPNLSIAARERASPFLDTAAVDAWDAWFRWRDHGTLRDLTVDATWDRVATSLASAETAGSGANWKRHFLDAFAAWQLLLDERILATAGTDKNGWVGDGLIAVLNVAAFVRAPSTPQAAFDQETFEQVAALAVRALDNAGELVGSHAPMDRGLKIGIVGLADAFALLGLAYDAADGRATAALISRSLAQGCHRGESQLVCERGASAPCTQAWLARARAQDVPAEIIAEPARRGFRHSRLTAITSQPRLAVFANNLADALDPIVASSRADSAAHGGPRVAFARSLATAHSGEPAFAAHTPLEPVVAQLNLRAAMRNWIDEPIDYPVLVDSEPDECVADRWATMAAALGLPPIRWRRSNPAVARAQLSASSV